MSDVRRIYPESKTGLINWIEENFHEIDEFIITFHMKDRTTMTVYDCDTYLSALGICALTTDTIQSLRAYDEFVPRKKE